MEKIFKHHSVTKDGYNVQGWVFGEDKNQALTTLQERLELSPKKLTVDFKATADHFLKAKLSYAALADYFKSFTDYMKSGFDLTKIFYSLALLSKSPLISAQALKIQQDIQSGLTLSEAYERTGLFPPMAITSVRIGEAAGAIDDISQRLAEYYQEKADFKTTLINSLIYPAFTVLAAIGLCYFVLTTVVPKVKVVVSKFAELPKLTEIVIGISDFILDHKRVILMIFIGIVGFIIYFKKTHQISFYTFLLKIPILGEFFLYFSYVDMFSSLGILLSNGIPLGDSLEILTTSTTNEFLQEQMKESRKKIETGTSVREAFSSDFFVYEIPTTLAIGEQTGHLAESFERLAEIFKSRLGILLKRFLTFLEPAILIFLGFIILMIALTFMLPIQHAVSNFQLH